MKLAVFIFVLCLLSIGSYAQNATATLRITLHSIQSVRVNVPQYSEQNVKVSTPQSDISLLNASSSEIRRFIAKQETLATYAQNFRSNKYVTLRSKDGLEHIPTRDSSVPTLLVYEINPR